MVEEKRFDAHAPCAKIRFSDSGMEFAFALILGTTRNYGGEIGEAFATVNSWIRPWSILNSPMKASCFLSIIERPERTGAARP